MSIVDSRWGWCFHLSIDEVVVVGRKQMAAWVLVDGRIECPYIDAFFHSSTKIVFLGINDFKIVFAEMVAEFARMLHDG